MRQLVIMELSSVSGSGNSWESYAIEHGSGSDQSYGGYNQTFDDGSTLSFDGNGNVLGGYDTNGSWYTPEQIAEYSNVAQGGLTNQQAGDFAQWLDFLMNGGWGPRK